MLLSAHDYSNQYFTSQATLPVLPAWGFNFTVQQLVSSAQVTQTGGTYD